MRMKAFLRAAAVVRPCGRRVLASALRTAAVIGLSCPSAWPAPATTDGGAVAVTGGRRHAVTYDCGSAGRRKVTYVNAEGNALAILHVDGNRRIFVNVASGSGARYVSGIYVWWTKGREASLYDVTRGPNAKPVAVCRGRSR